MKRVALVTGAAGFIGSHLSERLVSLGYKVIGLDNFDDFYPKSIKFDNIRDLKSSDNFQLEQGDIRDTGLLIRIFSENDINYVAHLAARAGVRPSLEHPLLYQDVNIGGTINLLDVCRCHGIKRFIFASSSSVYGSNETAPFSEEMKVDYPISPYAASKAAAELFCHTYSYLHSLPIVVLRFFTVYGPRQRPEMAIHRFVRMAKNDNEITLFGDGTSSRDYTYIDDIIDGFVSSLDYGKEAFQIFNLGCGHNITLNHIIGLIEKTLGKKAMIKYCTQPSGEVPFTLADISKARSLLGYQPKVTIEEGITNFVQWYIENRK